MVVFVVGLYKSGTSYITTLIESMGMPSVVDRTAITKGVHREYDIRESYRVNNLNNKIFEYYKANITNYTLDTFSENLPYEFKSEIKQIFDDYKYTCVIKDPRLIALLPYWINALNGEKYKIVWVKRKNKDNIIKSFNVDKWFDDKLELSVEQTIDKLEQNLELLIDSMNKGIVINYEDAVENKESILLRLYNYLTEYNKDSVPDGYFSANDILNYQHLVNSYVNKNTNFAELGVWKGRSLSTVMEILMRKNANIYAIDNFDPPHETKIAAEARKKDIEELFHKNMNILGYDNKITTLKMNTLVAPKLVDNNSFSFIFIDSYHNYEHCKKEIKLWLPKLMFGGIIAGHDYNTFDDINRAVKDSFNGEHKNLGNIWFFKKEN